MGEDWEVEISNLITITELMVFIEKEKGISRHRQQIRLKDGKVVPMGREAWPLRRFGILDKYLLILEPTLSGSWLWNSMDYYVDKLCEQIRVQVRNFNGKIELAELSKRLQSPPCIKTSLRVFIRKYPERFHIYLDTTSGKFWVEETRYKKQLPSFGTMPIEIGFLKHYETPLFDWDAYKDFDDTKPVELKVEIPDAVYELAIISANNIKRSDPLALTDPFCFVFFNDEYVGKTTRRKSTINAEWRDARFQLSLPASMELKESKLYVELWHAMPRVPEMKGIFLGSVTVQGKDIANLLGSGRSIKKDYKLHRRPAGIASLSSALHAAAGGALPPTGGIGDATAPGAAGRHGQAHNDTGDVDERSIFTGDGSLESSVEDAANMRAKQEIPPQPDDEFSTGSLTLGGGTVGFEIYLLSGSEFSFFCPSCLLVSCHLVACLLVSCLFRFHKPCNLSLCVSYTFLPVLRSLTVLSSYSS